MREKEKKHFMGREGSLRVRNKAFGLRWMFVSIEMKFANELEKEIIVFILDVSKIYLYGCCVRLQAKKENGRERKKEDYGCGWERWRTCSKKEKNVNI